MAKTCFFPPLHPQKSSWRKLFSCTIQYGHHEPPVAIEHSNVAVSILSVKYTLDFERVVLKKVKYLINNFILRIC